jgi:hypothetical protein
MKFGSTCRALQTKYPAGQRHHNADAVVDFMALAHNVLTETEIVDRCAMLDVEGHSDFKRNPETRRCT